MPKKSQLRCYFGCKKIGPLHLFPNPINGSSHTLERFNIWKSILPKSIQGKGNSYIHNNIRICNKHFMECYCLPSSRLTYNAVPTLFLEHQGGLGKASEELADPTDPLDQSSKDLVQEDLGSQGPIVQEEFGSQGSIVQEDHGSQGSIVQEDHGSQGSIVQEELGLQDSIEQEELGSEGYIVLEELGSQGSLVQERGSQSHIVQEEFGSHGHIVQDEIGSHSDNNIVLQPTNSEVYHIVIDTSESDPGPGSPKCYRRKHSKNKTVHKLKRKLENTSEKYDEMLTLFSKEKEMRFKELQSSMEVISKKSDELLKRISTLEKYRKADRARIKELEEKLEKLERKNTTTQQDESKETLCTKVLELGKIFNIDIDCSTITDIYRFKSKD